MVAKKVAKKTTGKKTTGKKVAKKTTIKKTVKSATAKRNKKETVKKKAVSRVISTPKANAPIPVEPGTKKLTAKQLAGFKEMLLALRSHVSNEYASLSRDTISANQRDPSLSDQGTDTFDREMELNMMGTEQEAISEIDAALQRIEKKTFGICELTGDIINIERLKVLPYVRYTVRAQSELEKSRAHYRPFGGTMRGNR